MKKIFVDAERLRDLNSGLGQFCLHLGKELVEKRPANAGMTFLVPGEHSGIFGEQVQYREVMWSHKFYMSGNYDIWHCTHQDSSYQPVSGQNKLILTIHDLNFMDRTDYSPDKKARRLASLQRSINRSAALTAISEYTASVVRQHLTIPEGIPFRVIYNGNSAADQEGTFSERGSSVTLTRLRNEPYFLFLGVIHPKKNVHVLLPLLEAFPDWALVLAGNDSHPYAKHIMAEAERLGIADRLIIPGAVDEATKHWLYENCGAFLFPSLSEGFGLPVVEAMTYGKPVFLSDRTSLPEIGGREAYYWDSFEPEAMAEVLFNGLSDFKQNPFRAERLRKRAAQFSWERAAQEYWALYQEVMKGL
ncbi:hypothetical protein GCM10023189_06360 [Nibrella saemangeumensis]|uniref:Uncharacterized protein n=1 Tax=Nibrella saemangeumensis TaxID=1084526 RepID=A0ABP8MFS1_9BACT